MPYSPANSSESFEDILFQKKVHSILKMVAENAHRKSLIQNLCTANVSQIRQKSIFIIAKGKFQSFWLAII